MHKFNPLSTMYKTQNKLVRSCSHHIPYMIVCKIFCWVCKNPAVYISIYKNPGVYAGWCHRCAAGGDHVK